MYYFAYGSNMYHDQMHQRYPNKHIKRAYLKGYKFVYDGNSSKRGEEMGDGPESASP
jgi:cation transport regulator ChaC